MSKTDDESCAVEKAILKSFNRQSLLSNDDSGWSGIRFQFTHSISASALPEEIVFPENAIHIYTNIPSDYVVEARINGRLQKSSLVTGHSLIIPRGTVYWQSDTHKSKGITLGFDSGFLTRTLSESIDLGCLELHPLTEGFFLKIHFFSLFSCSSSLICTFCCPRHCINRLSKLFNSWCFKQIAYSYIYLKGISDSGN